MEPCQAYRAAASAPRCAPRPWLTAGGCCIPPTRCWRSGRRAHTARPGTEQTALQMPLSGSWHSMKKNSPPRLANPSPGTPQDLDAPLHVAARKKISTYRDQYANNRNITFMPAITSTSSRMHGAPPPLPTSSFACSASPACELNALVFALSLSPKLWSLKRFLRDPGIKGPPGEHLPY